MAIEFNRTSLSGRTPEIWRGECKILPGGFKPLNTIATGTILRRGALLHIDFAQMGAGVVKVATVLEGSTTSKVRIAKLNYFAVGDLVTKLGDGKASPTILAIDTSNADYDVLTLSKAYSGLAKDDVIVEGTEYVAADADKKIAESLSEPLYVPNAVVGADKEFNGKGLPTIDAAFEAVVLYPSLNFTVPETWLNGFTLKSNPNILFIKQ